jgi:ring-1,2-phenylacetyl-CoA epoxidase subunit PaaD
VSAVAGAVSPANSTAPAGDDRLARARAALEAVTDPELPFLTIADMGILREVRERADGVIEIDITPTYSGCPATDVIRLDVEVALAKAGVANTAVRTVLLPAWTTDWLSADARAKLLANGIAPPVKASGKRALFASEDVTCPNCGGHETQRVSEFGSTACKAQYRCTTCREPFEYFKCI